MDDSSIDTIQTVIVHTLMHLNSVVVIHEETVIIVNTMCNNLQIIIRS